MSANSQYLFSKVPSLPAKKLRISKEPNMSAKKFRISEKELCISALSLFTEKGLSE